MILTEAELVRWGERIGRSIEAPVFVGLRGPLGAGKSVLARAVARGAGVEGEMPSPTFNLLFRYEARDSLDLVHVDLYRVEDPCELWELGWDELPDAFEIVLVEWPERAEHLLPRNHWQVELSMSPEGDDLREVEIRRVGDPPHLPGFPMEIGGGGR